MAQTSADRKFIVCNADEGDSGTFADRMIMEGDPFLVIEGMTTAGITVGATKGYIYIRSEYPHAVEAINAAIQAAKRVVFLVSGAAKADAVAKAFGGDISPAFPASLSRLAPHVEVFLDSAAGDKLDGR